ncbi:hypothetical protein BaRGS_00005280 [Batillaria attramentaria]|uniref:Uncharacterized protein n=1 Tax=Batillaria attramentaria TaxID=370345 RepID=A0ABD0LUT0_9CAEN
MSMQDSGFSFFSITSPHKPHGRWFTFLDYPAVLAGSCIGIGNVIDFPGFVSKHGGGAFLMAYFTVLCVSGVPLFYLETCLGRFTSMGPARCWEFAPLFTGVGYSLCVTAGITSVLYAVKVALAQFYFISSFEYPLSWATCYNEWNTEDCVISQDPQVQGHCRSPNRTSENGTCYDKYDKFLGVSNITRYKNITGRNARFSSEEYWNHTFGGDESGGLGQVVLAVMLLPYFALLVIIIDSVRAEHSEDGVAFFLKPNLTSLGDSEVKVVVGIVIWETATSMLFGLVIFQYLGSLKLAFIAYPESIPAGRDKGFDCNVFFLTLSLLGLTSQLPMAKVAVNGLLDTWPFLRGGRRMLIFSFCVVGFLLGLPFTCKYESHMKPEEEAASWCIGLLPFIVAIGAVLYKLYREKEDNETWIQTYRRLTVPGTRWGPHHSGDRCLVPYLPEYRTNDSYKEDPDDPNGNDGMDTSNRSSTEDESEDDEDESDSFDPEEVCDSFDTEEVCDSFDTEEVCDSFDTEEVYDIFDTEEVCGSFDTEEVCGSFDTEEVYDIFDTEEVCGSFDPEEVCDSFDTEEACGSFGTEEVCDSIGTEEVCDSIGTEEVCDIFDTEEVCDIFDTEERYVTALILKRCDSIGAEEDIEEVCDIFDSFGTEEIEQARRAARQERTADDTVPQNLRPDDTPTEPSLSDFGGSLMPSPRQV